MESIQKAFGHGLAIAAKISYQVFQSAVLNVLFIMDEEHLEIAIEQNIDLLPLFMIYAPRELKASRDLVGRMGRGVENKITLQSALKWLDEQCQRRHRRYYDVVVNLPKAEGSNPIPVRVMTPNAKDAPAKVYPPPGADAARVEWFWGNVQRLTNFVFRGEVPASSRRWGVDHLRWLAQQRAKGITGLDQLLEKGVEEVKSRQEAEKH